ncbi:MAG: universal stress protein, partial [Bacteroidales bacterium]|nr:universal stress protein [Bacteroidales bacterium]
ITFLHVIKDLSKEPEETQRLSEVAEGITSKYGVTTDIKIRAGKPSDVIKIMAEFLNAFLVVMKTQPPIGKERFLGSRTIRIMMGSTIPFYIAQEAPRRLAMRKVVFPIDFRWENKEKLSWINTLSKYYRQKIYLFKPKIKDYRVRNNLGFAKRFLEGKNIDYEIITANGQYNVIDETIEFAKEIKADALVIMLTKRVTFEKLLFGLKDQKYIANKHKIPVMCINPRTDLTKYEGFY